MLEREAMAILVAATGMRAAAREAAVRAAGSAKNVLADPFAFVRQLGESGAKAVLSAVRDGEEILEQIHESGVHLILRGEEGYPERLLEIPHPPHLLYVQGARDLGDALPVAIVGTRSASAYGIDHTRRIARGLAQSGACIVSGIALGIDAAAHEGALDAGGRTIAVLGSALDQFYPAANRSLRDRVLLSGGSVISEYPMGMPPNRYTFLHRNRIIAGMSVGVLVTDGPAKSGALKTATDAADYGREVFALPGDVDAPGSALPHKLLGEGAHLATCAADVLCVIAPQLAQEINARKVKSAPAAHRNPAPEQTRERAPQQETDKAAEKTVDQKDMPAEIPADLPAQERAVLEALSLGEMEFDELSEKTGIDAMTLGALLMGLEMDGLIDALAGLRYARRM